MTLRDRLAAYLKDPEQAGAWVDGRELATIAGAYAWRTRLSECRTQLGMQIENRQRTVLTHQPGCPLSGRESVLSCERCLDKATRYVISEYRYRPPEDREREREEDDGLTYGHPDDRRAELFD